MKILLLVFSVQIIYLPDILMERLKSLPYLDFVFVVNLLIHNLILYSVFKVQVVDLGGLEPPASRLSGVRSNLLSYRSRTKLIVQG